MTLATDTGEAAVLKDTSFTLTCQADANPLPTSYTLKRNDGIIDGATGETFSTTFLETDGIQTNVEYSCLVVNSVGQSEVTTTISVHCTSVNRTQLQ